MERVDGMPILDRDSRITINATSISFVGLNDTDVGNYTVRTINQAGVQTAIFQLSCEFGDTCMQTHTSRHVQMKYIIQT